VCFQLKRQKEIKQQNNQTKGDDYNRIITLYLRSAKNNVTSKNRLVCSRVVTIEKRGNKEIALLSSLAPSPTPTPWAR